MRLSLLFVLFLGVWLIRPAAGQDAQADHPFFTGPIYTAPAATAASEHLEAMLDLTPLGSDTAASVRTVASRTTIRLRAQQDSLRTLPLWRSGLQVDSVTIALGGRAWRARLDTIDAHRLQILLAPPQEMPTEQGSDSLDAPTDEPDSLQTRSPSPAASPTWGGVPRDDTFEVTLYSRAELGCGLRQAPPYSAISALWSPRHAVGGASWHPVLDLPLRPVTTALTVRLPEGWVAVSAGNLVRDGRPAGSPAEGPAGDAVARIEQRVPSPQRLLPLVAGAFAVADTSVALAPGQRVPVRLLAPAGRLDALRQTVAPALAGLPLLAERLGAPFPWPRLTVAAVPGLPAPVADRAGLLLVQDDLLDPVTAATASARSFALLEGLARQWVGHAVQAALPTDSWLNDGLATYLAALTEADLAEADLAGVALPGTGPDQLARRLHLLRTDYLEEASRYQRPLVWDRWTDANALRDAHSRAKGAWVLHQLSGLLGGRPFERGMGGFVRRHLHSTVDTEVLRTAMEQAGGVDLGPYFDRWVYAAGHPIVEVRPTYTAREARLEVALQQVQQGPFVPEVFLLSLEATVHTLAGSQAVPITLEEATRTQAVDVSMRPRFMRLDGADQWLLETRMDQDAAAWMAQARYGEGTVARLEALQALAAYREDPALLLGLRGVAQQNPPAPVRVALALLLGQLPPSPVATDLLVALADDPDPSVRAAALLNAPADPGAASLRAAAYRLVEQGAFPVVQAAAVRALGRVDSAQALGVVRSALVTPSPEDVVRRAGLVTLRDLSMEGDDLLALVEPLLEPTRPRATRLAALHTLRERLTPASALARVTAPLLLDEDPVVHRAALAAATARPAPRWTRPLQAALEETASHGSAVCASWEVALRTALKRMQE